MLMHRFVRSLTLGPMLALLPHVAGAALPRLFDTPWVGFDSSDYFTARMVYAGTVADFDNDGDPDVASSTWPNIPRVTVLLNNGDGNYAQPDIYTLPKGSQEIISADFDGDGFVDLVASNTGVNYEGTTVSLLRNNGDGTFAAGQQFACGGGPIGLAAADFDDDGDLDLVVANWGPLGDGSTVSLLLNNGNATFAAPLTFPAGDAPHRLAAADLNGDGLPDVAVANGGVNDFEPARVTLLMNNGAGGFDTVALPPFFPSLIFFPTIAVNDIDLDGDADILYSHPLMESNGQFVIALFENDESGNFGEVQGIPAGAGAVSLAVADVTGDGWPDILGAQLETERWSVLPSTGNGNFGVRQSYVSGEAPIDVEVADVDGDGDLDPIVFNRDSLEVCVHVNRGDGRFSLPTDYPISQFSKFFDHGDIDRDGDLDIVNAAGVSGRFEILRNNGDGTFPPFEIYVPPGAPLDVKLRDLNGDGSLDLLWNEAGPPYRFGTAMNNGAGVFINGVMWSVPTCGYWFAEIDAFDLDNDGDLDVVQIENLGCPNEPFSGRRVFLSENLGNGTFQFRDVTIINIDSRSVAGGDFNQDGNVDLIVTGQPGSILLGNGDFTFTLLDAAMIPGINVATGDLNGDEILDLAFAIQRNVEPFKESMAIQLGNGDGTFQPVEIYLGSHAPQLAQIFEILLGDPDADGDLDVMCLNVASNDVSFWANAGDGTFEPLVRYGVGESGQDMSYADFTGDGIADIATNTHGAPPVPKSIKIFEGLIGGQPAPGDGDGDGDVDLLDFAAYVECVTGPGVGEVPPGCEVFDFDGDKDVDFADGGELQLAFTGS